MLLPVTLSPAASPTNLARSTSRGAIKATFDGHYNPIHWPVRFEGAGVGSGTLTGTCGMFQEWLTNWFGRVPCRLNDNEGKHKLHGRARIYILLLIC